MTARESYKATSRANRRWRNFQCWHCDGRCASHHAIRPAGRPYPAGTVEYECPCGGLTLHDTKEAVTVGERGAW